MDTLDNIKKHLKEQNSSNSEHAGFTVPDGYFDSLQDKILDSLPTEAPIKKIPIWRNVGIAASICLLVACVFVLKEASSGSESKAVAMTEISTEESLDYLFDSEVLDITSEDLLELDNIDDVLLALEEEFIEH